MRLMLFRSIAASLLLALAAGAAMRPRYGGVLQIEIEEAIKSLDPMVAVSSREGTAARHLQELLFENLTKLNEHAIPQPQLATGWQHDAAMRHWEFRMRPGVRFTDGTPLDATNAAESLRLSLAAAGCGAEPAGAEAVVVDCKEVAPELPMTVSLPQHAIIRRPPTGGSVGTGPFKIKSWDSKRIELAANDDYWGGRPYLDGIEIQLQRPMPEQMIDLQLGKADAVEIAPEQTMRAQQEGRRVTSSARVELLALRFNLSKPAAQDEQVRHAIAGAIDRNSIHTVLLQRAGEASAGLLPRWMSGYSFLFAPSQPPPVRPLHPLPTFILNYDFADALAKSVAERIAVDVRRAGISMQPVGENIGAHGTNGDASIVRMRMDSIDPAIALLDLVALIGADKSKIGSVCTPEQLFRAESRLLEDASIVPLAHVPESFGLSPRVRNWAEPATGGWPLADVWLEMATAADHP